MVADDYGRLQMGLNHGRYSNDYRRPHQRDLYSVRHTDEASDGHDQASAGQRGQAPQHHWRQQCRQQQNGRCTGDDERLAERPAERRSDLRSRARSLIRSAKFQLGLGDGAASAAKTAAVEAEARRAQQRINAGADDLMLIMDSYRRRQEGRP